MRSLLYMKEKILQIVLQNGLDFQALPGERSIDFCARVEQIVFDLYMDVLFIEKVYIVRDLSGFSRAEIKQAEKNRLRMNAKYMPFYREALKHVGKWIAFIPQQGKDKQNVTGKIANLVLSHDLKRVYYNVIEIHTGRKVCCAANNKTIIFL